MRRILVTGATGIVGTALRPLFRGEHGEIPATDPLEIPDDKLAENGWG